MCNLYSITKGPQAIRDFARAMRDTTGNLPPIPGVFPDYSAPIVRNAGDGARELTMARWATASASDRVTSLSNSTNSSLPGGWSDQGGANGGSHTRSIALTLAPQRGGPADLPHQSGPQARDLRTFLRRDRLWIMKILVIGSTGPQGREFVARALAAGHAVC